MKRVVSPIGVRTALIAGLVMFVLAPASALASRGSCFGVISVPGTARQGSSLTITASVVQGDTYKAFLLSAVDEYTLASGSSTNNGNFTITATVPADFNVGPATVSLVFAGVVCAYQAPITILAKLTITPGVTITIPPALTTTTAAAPQATTTTAAPQSSSPTTTSSTTTTVPPSTSTSTEGLAETTTSMAAETTILDSTPTSLVAAAPLIDSGGGQPWSAWIIGGLVGLMLGAAGMLTAIRKGVLKV